MGKSGRYMFQDDECGIEKKRDDILQLIRTLQIGDNAVLLNKQEKMKENLQDYKTKLRECTAELFDCRETSRARLIKLQACEDKIRKQSIKLLDCKKNMGKHVTELQDCRGKIKEKRDKIEALETTLKAANGE